MTAMQELRYPRFSFFLFTCQRTNLPSGMLFIGPSFRPGRRDHHLVLIS